MPERIIEILQGNLLTYIILVLFALRAITYAWTSSWGYMIYWLCAFGITVSAEFLIVRWP